MTIALKQVRKEPKEEIPPEEQGEESGRNDNGFEAEKVSESVHGKKRHSSLHNPIEEHHKE